MNTASGGAERRADLLDRLQQTGDRHDAAELERTSAGGRPSGAEEALRRAAGELSAAAADLRQMAAEVRQVFAELLARLPGNRGR